MLDSIHGDEEQEQADSESSVVITAAVADEENEDAPLPAVDPTDNPREFRQEDEHPPQPAVDPIDYPREFKRGVVIGAGICFSVTVISALKQNIYVYARKVPALLMGRWVRVGIVFIASGISLVYVFKRHQDKLSRPEPKRPQARNNSDNEAAPITDLSNATVLDINDSEAETKQPDNIVRPNALEARADDEAAPITDLSNATVLDINDSEAETKQPDNIVRPNASEARVDDNAAYWMDKAEEYKNQNDYQQALNCCESALRLKPDNRQYLVYKVRILRKLNRSGEAREILRVALGHDNKCALLWNQLAILHTDEGYFQQALDCSKKALEIDINDKTLLASQGSILHKLKHYKKAHEALAEALKQDAKYDYAFYLQSSVYCSQNNIKQALKSVNKAIEIQPQKVLYLAVKALYLSYSQQYDEAIHYISQNDTLLDDKPLLTSNSLFVSSTIERVVARYVGYYVRGRHFSVLEYHAEAQPCYQSVIDEFNNLPSSYQCMNDYQFMHYTALLALQEFSRAEGYYATLIIQHPECKMALLKQLTDSLMKRGITLCNESKLKEALYYFEKVLHYDLNHQLAIDYRQQCSQQQNPPEQVRIENLAQQVESLSGRLSEVKNDVTELQEIMDPDIIKQLQNEVLKLKAQAEDERYSAWIDLRNKQDSHESKAENDIYLQLIEQCEQQQSSVDKALKSLNDLKQQVDKNSEQGTQLQKKISQLETDRDVLMEESAERRAQNERAKRVQTHPDKSLWVFYQYIESRLIEILLAFKSLASGLGEYGKLGWSEKIDTILSTVETIKTYDPEPLTRIGLMLFLNAVEFGLQKRREERIEEVSDQVRLIAGIDSVASKTAAKITRDYELQVRYMSVAGAKVQAENFIACILKILQDKSFKLETGASLSDILLNAVMSTKVLYIKGVPRVETINSEQNKKHPWNVNSARLKPGTRTRKGEYLSAPKDKRGSDSRPSKYHYKLGDFIKARQMGYLPDVDPQGNPQPIKSKIKSLPQMPTVADLGDLI